MDFLEILDFCGYDVEKAHKMAEAMKKEEEKPEERPVVYIIILP